MVDREPKDLNKSKGTDQRNGNRQAGHHRCSPVLQEQKQNQQHQHDRQAEGIHHTLYRRLNKLADVVDLIHRHTRRHLRRKRRHLLNDSISNVKSVAVRCLENRNRDRRMVIRIHRGGGVVIEAIRHFTHILQQQHVARRATANNQLIESINRHQIAVVFNQQRVGVHLITRSWRSTHQTTNRSAVLGFHRIDHIRCRDLVGGELHRINIEPVGGVCTAQDVDIGNTGHTLEWVVELFVNQAVQVSRIKLPLTRRNLVSEKN